MQRLCFVVSRGEEVRRQPAQRRGLPNDMTQTSARLVKQPTKEERAPVAVSLCVSLFSVLVFVLSSVLRSNPSEHYSTAQR